MSAIVEEASLAAMIERVEAAASSSTPLRIRGGGTKDWLGERLEGDLLDTRAHAGIVAYEPSELVVTARAGTALAHVEAALAEQRQMLAFEPPRFGPDATIGGCVAAGLSGPRRAAYGPASGSVRDFVLGVRLLDGRAQVLRFGGTVMKNVAGYDVSRLLTGSLGILGVLVDVTLKVLPIPECETTLVFALDEAQAIERMNRWAGQPWPISATLWQSALAPGGAATLAVRLSGSAAAIDAAARQLGGDRMPDAQAALFWRDARDQRADFFDGVAQGEGLPLWRLSVPATSPPLGLEGSQRIEWNGAQRWLRTQAPAADIAAAAHRTGGHATLWRAHASLADVPRSTRPSEAILAIHRRLKHEFDPANLFNRGRLFAEL